MGAVKIARRDEEDRRRNRGSAWAAYEDDNLRANYTYEHEDVTVDHRYGVDTSLVRRGPAEREIARDRDRSNSEAWAAYEQKNQRAAQDYDRRD